MSNVAIWKNSVIDVNTLYNQGLPADLTSLSPTGWWQLGSNSSFNSGVWTCLNQGTGSTSAVPANATSTATMTEDDITNGVGYSANGLGTSSIDIIIPEWHDCNNLEYITQHDLDKKFKL